MGIAQPTLSSLRRVMLVEGIEDTADALKFLLDRVERSEEKIYEKYTQMSKLPPFYLSGATSIFIYRSDKALIDKFNNDNFGGRLNNVKILSAVIRWLIKDYIGDRGIDWFKNSRDKVLKNIFKENPEDLNLNLLNLMNLEISKRKNIATSHNIKYMNNKDIFTNYPYKNYEWE